MRREKKGSAGGGEDSLKGMTMYTFCHVRHISSDSSGLLLCSNDQPIQRPFDQAPGIARLARL